MVLEKILSIFVVMAVGFAAVKAGAVEKDFVRKLSSFAMNVVIPFAFATSLDRSVPASVLPELGLMALWSFGVHAAAIAFSSVAYRRYPLGKRRVLTFATVFTNCAFIGLPVAQSLAGSRGVMFTAVYNLAYCVLLYTYGIPLFSDKAGSARWFQAFVNPGNISIAAGILLWALPFSLPAFALEAMGLMGRMLTPLAMFIVGANMAYVRLRGLFLEPETLVAAAVRLVVLPLALYGGIRLAGAGGTAPQIALLMTAMPAGAQTVVVSESMGGDSAFASRIVVATTLLSILTIPVFAGLAG